MAYKPTGKSLAEGAGLAAGWRATALALVLFGILLVLSGLPSATISTNRIFSHTVGPFLFLLIATLYAWRSSRGTVAAERRFWRYLPDGERIRETANLTPNYFLIGFEMCVNKDGDWSKTYRNSAELAAYLLGKFRLTVNDLYRHYDITGKDCPKMMLEPKPWQDFKDLISSIMAEALPVQLYKGAVNANELNVRSGPGMQNTILRKLPKNTRVGVFQQQGDWGLIGKGAWVNTKFLTPVVTTQRAVVTAAQGALVREGAAPVTKEIDALPKGAWIDLSDQNGDWYEHGPGRWINKADVNLVELRFGAVSGTTELNVRRGPNTTNPIVSRLKKDAPVEIIGEFDGWYQIGPFEWVFGKFITLQ